VKYCNQHGLYVCPLASAYRKNHTSEIFCTVLPVAVIQSSGDSAVCYVLPVLWLFLKLVLVLP